MKSHILIILLFVICTLTSKSQTESGWLDKGNYLENKLKTSQFSFVQFSPDGKTILTYSNDKVIRKWDTETGFLLKEIIMTKFLYLMYAISSDNKYFSFNYKGSDNIDSLFIFDIEKEIIICQKNIYSNYDIWGPVEMENKFIKFNPKTICVLLSNKSNYHYLGAHQSGTAGENFECCPDSCNYSNIKADLVPYKFEYSPDGKKYAISGYKEYTISWNNLNWYEYKFNYLFEIINTELKDTTFILDSISSESEYYNPHKPDYFLFTPDSKYLAVFDGNQIKYWDTETGKISMIKDDLPYCCYYYRIMFSFDMKYILMWENNNNNFIIHFIHLKDSEPENSFKINNAYITCLNLSADSSIVAGTSDGRLLLIKNIYSKSITQPQNSKINSLYPNPANENAQINFTLTEISNVKITLFDFMGKEIRTIINDNRNAGEYTESFETISYSEGMYFLKLQAGAATSLFKLMINR